MAAVIDFVDAVQKRHWEEVIDTFRIALELEEISLQTARILDSRLDL